MTNKNLSEPEQQEWRDHLFSPEEQQKWEDAGVEDPEAAETLQNAGYLPEDVDVISGEDVGIGSYVATIGYKYFNGDISLKGLEEFLAND